jgi:hypothetical protein
MSHEDAMKRNLGFAGLKDYDNAIVRLWNSFLSLKNRPDYDGFVTIDEGIQWAKDHPNTLPNNITPDNTLYLDASKLNFGNLSVSNIGLSEGKSKNVNLLNYTNWGNSSSRASTYALGNTKMQLVSKQLGTIKLFSDNYDWDFHNAVPNEVINRLGQLPWMLQTKRSIFIGIERVWAGIDNEHGFPLLFYGYGRIKTN